jgi:hypothetical protein
MDSLLVYWLSARGRAIRADWYQVEGGVMRQNPERSQQPEVNTVVYVISKCWYDEHGRVLSVPVMGLQGELQNEGEVMGCISVLNASEKARFGPSAKFFYSYKSYPKQLIDDFPFG